jgi:hypothetical protein
MYLVLERQSKDKFYIRNENRSPESSCLRTIYSTIIVTAANP